MFILNLRSKLLRSTIAAGFIALLTVGPQIGAARLASLSTTRHGGSTTDQARVIGFDRSSAQHWDYPQRALTQIPSTGKVRAARILASSKSHKYSDTLNRLISAALETKVVPPRSAAAKPDKAPYTKEQFEELSKLISDTPIENFDMDLFKKVYKTPHAPDMLKLIMGQPDNAAKNRKLGNLRKWYDWSIQADYARDHYITIENTNQGKDNGSRSDLDATANILESEPGSREFVIRDRAARGLINYQAERYRADGLSPDGVDVTLFNGDTWLPDWRDSRMSYDEFRKKLFSNTYDLKNRKGAYYVPGAHKEQAHDRALAEGHTVQIGWDYVKKLPTVNGRTVEFDFNKGEIIDVETKEPIKEYNTREMAKAGIVRRYANVEVLETTEAWRRALGNAVQNTKEFLGHDEPLSRNKYFIERAIDQAAGRFVNFEGLSFAEGLGSLTHLSQNSYVSIHGSDLDGPTKDAWKKAFITQAFGIPEGDAAAIKQIQSVLDRSSEIQLDKTKKWHHGNGADYLARRKNYYSEELKQAEENLKKKLSAEGKSPGADFEELKLKEAERLFVEEQRKIMIDGGVRVVEETFKRDFSKDGARLNRDKFKGESPRKIMVERGIELALLMDAIETAPGLDDNYRAQLRDRIINAIPAEARELATKLAKLSQLKMGLMGRINLSESTGKTDIRPSELMAQVEEEMKRLLGDDANNSSPVPEDAVRKAIFSAIYEHLGPVEREKFQKAWEAGKRAMVAKFGASAYWNEIKEQADFLMATGAALGMVNAYQQHCAGQTGVLNEDCISGLAWEAGNQTLYMLPGINTGFMIFSGLRAVNEGKPEGFISLALGTASLPGVASRLGVGGAVFIKVYIAYQIAKLGYAVTIGYAMQAMENDAVEQAFKALPEPGRQARRYDYPNQPWDINKGDTPTTPLLSDVIRVDADGWDAEKRYRVAKEQFAPSIQDELNELGLKPDTDAWYTKRAEIIRRYASALPYSQRGAQIYQVFSPKVQQLVDYIKSQGRDAGEDFVGMQSCLEVREAKVEEKYKAPPSVWDRLRFWRDDKQDKQQELNQVWSDCIRSTAQADAEILSPVFGKYLDGWFARQSDGYRLSYDNPAFRAKLVNALINEYVVKRHIDLGYEKERQIAKAARVAKEEAGTRIKLVGNVLKAQEETRTKTQSILDQAAERNYAGDPPDELAAKPELKLKTPKYAVRLSEEAPIDIAARGMYYRNDEAKNDWKVVPSSEISNVTLEQPDNLVMTKRLEEELKQDPSAPPRRFVKLDEKLTAELRDGSDNKIGSAEGVVNYYDVLPTWKGNISVEVRAEGPATKDKDNPRRGYPYSSAPVKLSGPAQGQKESEYLADNYAGVSFSNLPAGGFSIHVDPQPNDKLHSAVDATVALSDFAPAFGWIPDENKKEDQEGSIFAVRRIDKDQGGKEVEKNLVLVRWKDADSITVVLPYVPPPEPPEKPDQTNKPTDGHQPPAQQPGGTGGTGKPGSGGQGGTGAGQTGAGQTGQGGAGGGQQNQQAVLDCQKLIAQAEQLIAAGDMASAARTLKDAEQKNCGGLDPALGQGLTNAQQQIDNTIKNTVDDIKQNMSAGKCEFEEAWRLAQQIQRINPNHPALAAVNLSQLSGLAMSQHAARAELRAGKAAIENKNLDGAIGSLAKALYVPGLPDCMRAPIVELKTELERRKEFIGLTEQVEQATTDCDYDKAANLIGRISNLRPRYQFISDWLNPNILKIADLQNRKKQALNSLNNAENLTTQASTLASADPADWNAINTLLTQAMNALADADRVGPKCMKERQRMDPLRQRILDIQRRKKGQIETSIVLLIDTSGSMADNNKIGKAKDAARKAVRNASKTTEMAILSFDGGCGAGSVKFPCLFTTDVSTLLAAIDGLGPGGGTPMYIAVGVATDYASKKGQGKQGVVILMSDGGDTCRDQMAKAAADIRASNIPVNTIGFDVGDNQQAQQDMRNLAGITGGRSFSASAADPNEIINAFRIALLPSLFKDFDLAAAGTAVQGYFSAAKMAIQQQDLSGASFQLQQAYKVSPDSPAVNFNLSLVQEANDQPLSAIKHAENYLKLAPNALDRSDVEKRVASMRQEVQRNPRAQYDPNSCREIYNWAQIEKESAKKDVGRRQAVLEILISSQRGDCETARKQQEAYKQRFH